MDPILLVAVLLIIVAGALRAFSVVDGRVTGGAVVLIGLLFLWLSRGA
jgi:hypothetical protein